MGQTGSAQLDTLPNHVEAHPLPVKKIPPPRPTSPPKRPRSPTKDHPKYAVPENKVLPAGDLQKRRLRPVSLEVSKVYPEFAELFPKQDSEDEEESMDITENDDNQNQNDDINLGEPIDQENNNNVTNKQINGSIPNGAVSKFSRSLSFNPDGKYKDMQDEPQLRRTHSLDRSPVRPKGHRRQVSVTTSLMNEQNTIFEDPRESLGEAREHLYDEWRKDPYTNATPSVVSLPVKSKFEIDVTYNMTYAQLAEHRRKKNLEDLQKKTGINVGQLHTDLADKSTIQYNPFQRQYSRESTRSTSTTSSEAHGVSKRKKKRAPPPPGTKQEGSIENEEPPIDYDVDEPAQIDMKPQMRRTSVISTTSHMSTKSKMAPPPPVTSKPDPVIECPDSSTSSNDATINSHDPPQPTPSSVPESTLQDSSTVNQKSATTTSQTSVSENMKQDTDTESKLEKAAQEQLAIDKLEKLLSSEENKIDESESSDSEIEEKKEAIKSEPAKSPEKRLNSLVLGRTDSNEDPDRVRILKPKIPPVITEKPKDANEIFREALARAYEDRTKRREEELKKKEEQEKLLEEKRKQKEEEKNMLARSEKKHEESVQILRRLSQDLDKKWITDHVAPVATDGATTQYETDDDLPAKENKGHRRVFSEDWTPEHDLDSDDDIEDRHSAYSHHRSTSEGFKSSIIPNKFSEVKKNSKSKYSRKQTDTSEEKQKYGSIRKLKKSVNKSVRNAFGSLSRASGKLLRKQKSVDIDIDESPQAPGLPSNWHLSASTQHLNGQAKLTERRRSEGDLLSSDDDDSHESETEKKQERMSTLPNVESRKMNGHVSGLTNSLPREYSHASAFTNSLPREYKSTDQPSEETSSRLFKKKKKKNSYLFNSKDTPVESLMSEQIKQKQHQIELEKQRQLDIEEELLRLRALEQEERFQRLQTAHFQQQLQVLQQSMSGTMTAPPLPQPGSGGLRGYSVPDYTAHSGNVYPHMINQHLPQSPVSTGMSMPFSHGNHSMPNLSSIDINYLSNLMRMNGVQPPSTSQQWAYLLNSVSLTPHHAQVKSMYSIPTVSSQSRPVKSVYVTTSGPDLTKLFAKPTMDDSCLPNPKKSMMDLLAGTQQPSHFADQHHMHVNNLLQDYERSDHTPAMAERVRQRSNPVYNSSDDEDLLNGLSPARTSRNYTASTYVKDYRPMPNEQQMNADSLHFGTNLHTQMHGQHISPGQRQRLPEEDSSSGADR